ncbi:MAG: CBS domain-containing protein, partial [Cyanobacteria bacterium]|nr:CBS domain-containing protein [Cyanobacteriota bacterium]
TQSQNITQLSVESLMSRHPKLICADDLAVTALRIMEEYKITVLVIEEERSSNGTLTKVPTGVIHLHDILKTGIS